MRDPRRLLGVLALALAVTGVAALLVKGEGGTRIDAERGGTASSPLGVRIAVPPGALEDDATFRASKVDDVAPRSDQLLGPSVRLSLGDAEFAKPVRVTFQVNRSDLPPDTDPGEVMIATLDETNGLWVDVGGVWDPATETVSAEVSHFSIFGAVRRFIGKAIDKLSEFGKAVHDLAAGLWTDLWADLKNVALVWSAPAPTCRPADRSGSARVSQESGSPFKACAEALPGGATRVRLASNRTYAVTFPNQGLLEHYGLSIEPIRNPTIGGAAWAEYAKLLHQGFVPGQGETALTLRPDQSLPYEFAITPSWVDMAADVALLLVFEWTNLTGSKGGKHLKEFPAKGCARGEEAHQGRRPPGVRLCLDLAKAPRCNYMSGLPPMV